MKDWPRHKPACREEADQEGAAIGNADTAVQKLLVGERVFGPGRHVKGPARWIEAAGPAPGDKTIIFSNCLKPAELWKMREETKRLAEQFAAGNIPDEYM